MTRYIRPATKADSDDLLKICLLTGNYGTSAEHILSKHELLGLVYAVPYVNMSKCWAFVLCEKDEDTGSEEVGGYILGAEDTQAYEAELEERWWPDLRVKYPVDGDGTETDKYFYELFANPNKTGKEVTDVYASHFHIDLLPKFQRQGWGTNLVDTVIKDLESKGHKGMWAGIDSRNDEGRKWYKALEFRHIPSKEGEYYVMDFDRWHAREKKTS